MDFNKMIQGMKEREEREEKPSQQPKSPLEMETTGNPEEDKRLKRIIEERVRKGYDSEGLYNPYTIKDMDYLGFGSLDALEESVFGKTARKSPHDEAPKEEKKQELFDEYGLATPFGEEESARFSEENKVDDIYGIGEKAFSDLVNKAMEKYGIKDRDRAAEFLISNPKADENWKRYLAKHGTRNK